jgi:hypothetical protein
MMIAKGLTVGIICLVLGGVIAYKATWWEMDRNAEMLFKGRDYGRNEALQKK